MITTDKIIYCISFRNFSTDLNMENCKIETSHNKPRSGFKMSMFGLIEYDRRLLM